MSRTTLHENLYWQLLRVAINAKHGLMSISEKYGLTVMQLYTLCMLDGDMAVPMNSLSVMLNCDASNITGIVDRLFLHKLIKRQENPKDRREKMITITPKGAKLCEKISKALLSYQPASLTALSDEQKRLLLVLLHKATQPVAPISANS